MSSFLFQENVRFDGKLLFWVQTGKLVICYWAFSNFFAKLFLKSTSLMVSISGTLKSHLSSQDAHKEPRAWPEDHCEYPIAPYLCKVNIHTCQLAVKMHIANAIISVIFMKLLATFIKFLLLRVSAYWLFSSPEKVALPPFDRVWHNSFCKGKRYAFLWWQ